MADKNNDSLQALQSENTRLRKENNNLKKKLSVSNSAFLNTVGKSLDGIIIVDENRVVVYTNYAAMELFDRNLADLLGEPLELTCDTRDLFENLGASTELKIPQADGSVAIAEVSLLPTEWNNESCFVVSFRDITQRKKTEEVMDYMSKHDFLTDLPNRVYFEKQLNLAIEEAKLNKQYMALLYLDLDNFKSINDTLGHDIGDLLLKKVSAVLQESIRVGDTVARLGGDEFALILSNLQRPSHSARIAQTMLEKLDKVFKLEGKSVRTSASIGIATYPISAKNPMALIKNADIAMYNAKHRGKNQYRFFSEKLNRISTENLQITSGLRTMIEADELFLVYQPIVEMNTMRCCGVESLLRWKHPALGLVPPDRFLPFAEEAGMLVEIGGWVMKHALFDYKQLGKNRLSFISINMSASELDAARTAEMILEVIRSVEVETHHVILELTETSIMRHPENAIKKFQELADIGVLIAVDDFGTGYSSLNYLKRLPLFILKIDKSFVDDIGKDKNNEAIVRSTIQLAHSLGLKVIGEGVETKEQCEFLKMYQCDYVQGYYYSKPLKLEDLKDYLEQKD